MHKRAPRRADGKLAAAMATDFRQIVERSTERLLVLRADADFTVVTASDAYLHGARARREDVVGRPLAAALAACAHPPSVRDELALRASLARAIDSRAPDTMPLQSLGAATESSARHEQRCWRPVNTPVIGDDGQVHYLVHRVDDATDILEGLPEGFFVLDREWRFAYANAEAGRLLARDPAELQGKVLWEEFPGLEDSDFERAYLRAMLARESTESRAYYPAHGRWYHVRAHPAPEGISVHFRDVTTEAQVAAERAWLMAESEQQRRIYETALSNTPDLVYIFDLDHRFTYANAALLKMWGRTREEALGRTCLELGYEPWHAAMHDAEIETVVATRAPIRGEVPFTGTNGRRIYDYIFAPVTDSGGQVIAIAGTTRDVTERRQSEQALREQAERLADADRAKDEFLATLAHELRNPLAPLRNALALLRFSGDAGSQAAPMHAMMERQVNHLVRLVDDLLDVSRVSRGAFVLRTERVALAEIVRNAVETSQPLIDAGRHRLQIALPAEPIWLDGDPVRLAQVLSNLLNNAAKYTEEGGEISLRAEREDGRAVVTVRDTGVGIAPEAIARLFSMFSREERTSARAQGGLGIGLALARRLAEMHGGTLDAHSEGPGEGSTFTLRLPAAAVGGTADGATHERPGAVGQRRVLVVDDNADAGDSLGMVLRCLGADARIVRSGPEALDAFHAYRPSVVLLDIGMPGMDGYEVARALRARYPDDGAAIVALTGWDQERDRRRAREAGFDNLIVKPVEVDALQALLLSLETDVRQR
jgi:PAS domain S-box-containing protein